jgi:hypothetical protein
MAFWNSHSGTDENFGLLECYAVSTDKYLPTFRKIVKPLFSGCYSAKRTILSEYEDSMILRNVDNYLAVGRA